MNLRNRLGVAIATVALGVVGMLGLAACSPGAAAAARRCRRKQSALTALGFTDSDVTTGDRGDQRVRPRPAPTQPRTASAPAAAPARHPPRALRGHVEHGQITVETKNGDKTIDVQRGTVTAITATTVTVKSTDGFTLTWTSATRSQVIEHRTKVAAERRQGR